MRSDAFAGELTGELGHRIASIRYTSPWRSLTVTPDGVVSEFGALRPDCPLRHLADLQDTGWWTDFRRS